PPAPETSKKFLKRRLTQNDSIILIAFDNFQAAGFCQIYPSFSSVAMKPLWILNDLFVNLSFRQQGVAQQLIEEVESRARNCHIFSIKLATAVDNHQAQKLYQKLGYQKNNSFEHFSKKI
ncbi:MAG: GNAT family N-acetyltransferase, partial [Kangiellaceae bacterium]|nr:GNAT family N-acetyltransferase [Kangiellaceae bacterium]